MFKIIALVRVSSDIQDTASQKEALLRYIVSLGFKESEIKIHEVKASATKAKKDYTDFIDGIKSACLENDIKNICVFHLNRIGRKEEFLFGFKRFCVEQKVQLYCMEPAFKLLKDDGTVDPTSDIIYNLYISFVQSETREREAKIKRGKTHNHLTLNKYAGGRVLYGYSVNTDGDVIVNPEEAENVQRIFDMYATGRYSGAQICEELNLKNVKRRGGKWYPASVNKMLGSEVYSGGTLESGFRYPAIVTKDMLDRCLEVKMKNVCGDKSKESKLCNLGAGLIRCLKCRRRYIGSNLHYQCVAKHNDRYLLTDKCDSPIANMKMVDGILWSISKPLYVDYMTKKNEDDALSIQNEIAGIELMIAGIEEKKNEIQKRRESLEERYYSGKMEMTEQKFLNLVESNSNEIRRLDADVDVYRSRIEMLNARMKSADEPLLMKILSNERSVDALNHTKDKEICRDIIRSVISEVNIRKDGKITYVDVKLYDGRTVEAKYLFRSRIKFDGETPCGWFKAPDGSWLDYIFESWNREQTGYVLRFEDKYMALNLNIDLYEQMVQDWSERDM